MALDFNLTSEFTPIARRSFAMGDATILNPNSVNPLVLGEFLELNLSYQLIRGAVDGALVPSFAIFAERGRTDMQAIGRAPALFLNSYEADTKIIDATGLVTYGQPLMVGNVTIGALVKRGLKLHAGAAHVVGFVTRLPASNNGYLRFVRNDA